MKKSFYLLLSLLLFSSYSFAQSSFDQGMKAFIDNDREDAIASFESSIASGDDVTQSHLVLSFIYSMKEDNEKAFGHFQQFMTHADNPYVYLQALFTSGDIGLGGSKKDKVRLAFLENLTDDASTPERLKCFVNNALGDHYFALGKFKDAKRYYDQIMSIDAWSSVGPFENLSASGFNKDFGALANPRASHSFRNKYGAKIKWFEVYGPRIDKWLDNEYFFSTSNGIIYSQSFVRSSKKQKVQLRLGVSGSVKMWLNDHLVFEEAEERNNNYDTYIIETSLEKGNNRILIQIGESEINSSNHLLRITDEEGFSIEGLTVSPFGTSYSKAVPEFKIINSPVETYFENLVEQDPSILNRIMLSTAYLSNDKQYQARKVLDAAMKDAPNSSYLKLNMANIYIREGNRTGLAILLEWFKENDLNNPVSIGLTFNEALEDEDYELADSILDIYQEQFGYTADYYDYAIDLAGDKDETEHLIELIEEAYLKYKEVRTFVTWKAVVEEKVNNNTGKAIKILKKYVKKNYSTAIWERIAGLYFQQGKVDKGLDIYFQQVEDFPYYVGTWSELSDFHFQMRDYRSALKYIEKSIDLAPYVNNLWKQKGEILEEMEEYADAQDAYERAIELYPNNYSARESLRLLNDEKSVFELFDEEDYYAIFEKAPGKEAYPDDNSVILHYETQKVVYEGGGSEEKVIMLVKVFNTSGADDWSEYSIPIYNFQNGSVEKVEVIKKDGSKLEAERSGTHVVFTNLEPGDGILVVFKVKNYYFGKLAFNFWEQHPFTLSYPYVNNTYSLLISPKVKFQHTFSNGGFEPSQAKKGDFDLYTWTKRDQPAVKSENYMTQYVDFGENLFLSTFKDWTEISNWYSDLAATKSKPDFEVKEKVAELFEGKEGLTDREKVEIIYNFIVKEIRYSSVSFRQSGLVPQKASDVLNTKIGDCKDVSTLFVSMCKEAGIEDVGLVLINTRDNGRKDLMLPSISFNHCIARVKLDGINHYIELTSENYAFLTYGDKLINAYALEIYDENEGVKTDAFYLDPENRAENSIYRETVATVNGKNIDMDVKNTKTGNWGSHMRYLYKDESSDEQRKRMLNALNNGFKNVDLDELEFSAFDTLTQKYDYSYTFTIKNAVSKIAGLNIFVVPWSDSYESSELVSDENRQYPIDLWRFFNYDTKKEVITIILPSGKRLAERPKNVYIDNQFATYSLKYKVVGNKVTVTRQLTPKTDFVAPEDFEKLKAFIEKVIEHDTDNLAFR